MSGWYSEAGTVSLGSATGTKIDSGCKHIVTCRVDTSTLQELCAVATDLSTNHKYNLKQGDIVLCTGNTWCDTDITKREDAYPLVISNLGDMKELAQKVMKFVYHNASSVYDRDQMLKAFRGDPASRVRFEQGDYFQVNAADGSVKNPHEYRNAMKQIRDCLGMGVALTEAPAIGTKGDTAASVMIGGMITVTNGAFKMRTGDLVQVYWEFERDCFYKDGKRKPMAAARLQDQTDLNSNVYFTNRDLQAVEEWDNNDDEKARRDFALRGTAPFRQRRIIALVKPYMEDEEQPRLYDRLRVIGRANHDAGPGQFVDVKLSTQSL